MKIKTLILAAFGHFTDLTIDLASERPGLHLIYGANEAGKSSTLRALKAWLFGFAERTSDNFIHPNPKLLVGGTLVREDGQELTFFRRKKRKADICDQHDNIVAPAVLASFLPVTEQAIFETLYGLSHEELLQGGANILAQEADLGQALFAAGAGISSLRKIQDDLDREALELFKASGSVPEINQLLRKYKELQKKANELMLSSREWQELDRALADAQKRLKAVEDIRAQKAAELLRLNRIKQALPQLELRRKLQQELAALGQVRILPDDFAKRRREIEKNLHTLKAVRQSNEEKLAALDTELAAIPPFNELLDFAEAIEDLHQRLGGIKTALNDRPEREGQRKAAKSEAAGRLKLVRHDLPLAEVETLRPLLIKRNSIINLASRYNVLEQRISKATKQLLALDNSRQRVAERFKLLPGRQDNSGLEQAIRNANRAGTIDERVAALSNEIKIESNACLNRLQQIGLLELNNLDLLMTVSLPMDKTIIRYNELFRLFENSQKTLEKEQLQTLAELREVETKLQELNRAGSIPTEAELQQVRAERDHGWQLLRKKWLQGEDTGQDEATYTIAGLNLPDTFEHRLQLADTTADRLRWESERVHNFATLTAKQEELNGVLAELAKLINDAAVTFAKTDNEWRQLWADKGISPLPPNEMLTWLNEFEKIRQAAIELNKKQAELSAQQAERSRLKEKLLAELTKLGDQIGFTDELLEPVLNRCEQVRDKTAKNNELHKKLQDELEEFDTRLTEEANEKAIAENDLTHWRQQWQATMAELGAGRTILPDEANEIIENLQQCFILLKEADDFHKRISGIDRNVENFRQEVAQLLSRIAPDLSGRVSNEQAVLELYGRLARAKENKNHFLRLGKELADHQERDRQTATEIASHLGQLDEFCRIAECREIGLLDEAERKSQTFRELSARIAESEKLLIEGAAGFSITELEAQAMDISPDQLPGLIQPLEHQIRNEIALQIKELSELIGEKRARLQQMDGRGEAGEAAEEAAQVLAKLGRVADRYVKLKLASKVLKDEIERFRSENQDPVLKIASDYFRELTINSFAGLRAEENEQGQLVVVGLRPKTAPVHVEEMSSGTRDQLYLALRLAALRYRLAGHAPMPLIVDDILVNFDDARSLATLRIFAELAEINQVILFTHHRRVVEQAQSLDKKYCTHIHEI